MELFQQWQQSKLRIQELERQLEVEREASTEIARQIREAKGTQFLHDGQLYQIRERFSTVRGKASVFLVRLDEHPSVVRKRRAKSTKRELPQGPGVYVKAPVQETSYSIQESFEDHITL